AGPPGRAAGACRPACGPASRRRRTPAPKTAGPGARPPRTARRCAGAAGARPPPPPTGSGPAATATPPTPGPAPAGSCSAPPAASAPGAGLVDDAHAAAPQLPQHLVAGHPRRGLLPRGRGEGGVAGQGGAYRAGGGREDGGLVHLPLVAALAGPDSRHEVPRKSSLIRGRRLPRGTLDLLLPDAPPGCALP